MYNYHYLIYTTTIKQGVCVDKNLANNTLLVATKDNMYKIKILHLLTNQI